ncbi:MAG: hypothetical protein V9G13_09195 [Marmoricola sp.]|nr:hypothetical protein [Nocardioidaceae bacterium]HMY08190.1 hypothetical protein [Marmoricola sp.]
MLAPTHGIGGATDLPIPLPAAIIAGVTALVASFAILVVAWREPRYYGHQHGKLLPTAMGAALDSPGFRWSIRGLGLVFFGYATWAMIFGPDLITNPTLGIFYVLVWVGLVPASLLFGPIVRLLSPLRTLHLLATKMIGIKADKGLASYPGRLGYWPAALGLFGFVWQELVNPNSTYVSSVQLWLAIYAGAMLVGAAAFGDIWFARADPFEVFATLIGKLSIWGRDPKGRPLVRSPLANLAHVEIAPGLVAVVSVLLGSTAFDSFKATSRWYAMTSPLAGHEQAMNTLGLIGFCVFVAVTFTMAARATPSAQTTKQALPNLYASSVIPIIVGYFVAHYLTYFYQMSQQTLIQLSDPLAQGSNLLGTASWQLHYGLSNFPTPLAITKVAAIVVGHILGAVMAHDRAVSTIPKPHRLTGQLAMMATMVGYTTVGLFLLFSS